MASVTLEDAWLHDADDLSTSIAMTLTGLTVAPRRAGEVRWYAGGRRRVITRAGRTTSFTAQFDLADRADVDTLEGWLGRKLLWRDPRGRVEFVTALEVQVGEMAGVDGGVVNLSVVFDQVSGTVAV